MLQYFPNITGSLQVTGSVSVSGSITATGGIIVSGSIASASYSSNSELLDNLDSTAFVFTSSFNTYSSSMSSRVGNIEGNYATTGSNIFLGAQTVCANITSTGTIIAQTLNVQQVTSSIVYSSGSNTFGCSLSNTQQFTGSVTMTGSLGVAGNTCVGGTITGTTVYGSTLVCSAMVCSPQSAFTYTGTTGNAVRINGDNLTTGTALSIVANNGSPSHTGNVVEICNAFNAGAAAKLLCLYQGDDGDGIYVNMARGGVGLTIDGVGSGYSAIFNNGNVGIGCTAPSQKLDIGSGHIKLSDGYGLFYGTQTQVYASEASKYVRFDIAGTSGVMFLSGSGNVGIGTTDPQSVLSQFSTSARGVVVSNTYPFIAFNDTDGCNFYVGSQACLAYLWNLGNDAMIFGTNNTERMRITSEGNVGIGAISPASILELCAATPIITLTQTTGNSNQGINFNTGATTYGKITNNSATGILTIQNGNTTGDGYLIRFITDGNERLRLGTTGIACFACTVCAPTFTLTPEIISNSGTAFFTNWGGIKFYCGSLGTDCCFGSTGGTYSPMFVYIASFDGSSGRAGALFMTSNPAANAGTILISQGGSYTYCGSFGAANTISFAFDGSTRGPRIVNKTGVTQTFYMYVFGGA